MTGRQAGRQSGHRQMRERGREGERNETHTSQVLYVGSCQFTGLAQRSAYIDCCWLHGTRADFL